MALQKIFLLNFPGVPDGVRLSDSEYREKVVEIVAVTILSAEATQNVREHLKAARIFVRDCIDNGHDRTMLANMYGALDEIDAALAKTADVGAKRDGA